LLSALIADGVTIRDDEGPGRAFMRALDSIGEVEETLCISVKRGYLQRTDMHAIRSNITELNRMITEVINA
jgi:four helix bundle protein